MQIDERVAKFRRHDFDRRHCAAGSPMESRQCSGLIRVPLVGPVLPGRNGERGARSGDGALKIFKVAGCIVIVRHQGGGVALARVTPFLIGVLGGESAEQHGCIERIIPHLLREQDRKVSKSNHRWRGNTSRSMKLMPRSAASIKRWSPLMPPSVASNKAE